MPQVQITPAALPISNPGAQPIYGQNNGNNVIYLSTGQDVSPTNYHALVGPGGSFTWPANEALYACTDAASTTLLTYLTNGATVDTGDVLAKGSNSPVLIDSVTTAITTALQNTSIYSTGNAPGNQNPLSLSGFSSLIVRLAVLNSLVLGYTGPLNYLALGIAQYDPSVFGAAIVDNAQWLYDTTNNSIPFAAAGSLGVLEFAVPVRQKLASLSLALNIGQALGRGSSLVMNVYGSYESLATPRYNSQSKNLIAGKPSGSAASISQPTLVTTTIFPGSTNDPGNLSVVKSNAGAGSAVAQMFYAENGLLVGPIASARTLTGDVNGTSDSKPLVPPYRPLQIVFTTAAVAGASSATFAQ
jgi:hypothetical protein